VSVNAPAIGATNRRTAPSHKIGANKSLGGTVTYVADPTKAEEESEKMTGVLVLCYLLSRDSLVLAQSDTVDLPGYLEMVKAGREVARGLRDVMGGNVRDYLATGFAARKGEGEIVDDGGLVVFA